MRKTNNSVLLAIIGVLLRYPQGIWLRRLAQEAKIPPSTLHYHISNSLSQITQSSGAKGPDGNYFGIRVIKLKQGVLKRLERGESLENILTELKTLSMV